MRTLRLGCLMIACLVAFTTAGTEAATISALYGDFDGFGVGAVATLDPTVSHAGPGEAPFTDVRLIGDAFSAPAFAPTGGFSYAISPGDTIISAVLTMSAGALDTHPTPVDGPNQLLLDGLAIPSSFFNQFTLNNGGEPTFNFIEAQSISLPSTFFALLADGSASLNGTHISERLGSGSFQVDYLRLDVTTQQTTAVPEPASLLLLGSGLAGLRALRRKRQN